MNVPHYNGLTPAQAERLALLAEECAEVIKAICKIQRHGYLSYNPDAKEQVSNRVELERECGDMCAALGMLIEARDLDEEYIARHSALKLEKVKRWLHHQEEQEQ